MNYFCQVFYQELEELLTARFIQHDLTRGCKIVKKIWKGASIETIKLYKALSKIIRCPYRCLSALIFSTIW